MLYAVAGMLSIIQKDRLILLRRVFVLFELPIKDKACLKKAF